MTSTLFVFWLEDTCVPDDKIPEIAWAAHKGGSYLAVTPLLREGGLISRPGGVLMDRHRGDFNSEFQSKEETASTLQESSQKLVPRY